MSGGWLLFVDGRLTGWHAYKPTALQREYENEGHKTELRGGSQREAAEVWTQERSEAARRGWETRRKKASA